MAIAGLEVRVAILGGGGLGFRVKTGSRLEVSLCSADSVCWELYAGLHK